MTDTTLINRAKEALEGWDRVKSDLENFDGDRRGHVAALTEYAEMLNGKTARDLARALIREHETTSRLTKRLEALRTYFDLSEEELGDLTRDERADCVRQHRLICEALAYRKAQGETDNDK